MIKEIEVKIINIIFDLRFLFFNFKLLLIKLKL